MCESHGKRSKERDRKNQKTESSYWGGGRGPTSPRHPSPSKSTWPSPFRSMSRRMSSRSRCPTCKRTQFQWCCGWTEDTAALSTALYLLAEKFLHGFSELRRADLAVTVGVELWVVVRQRPEAFQAKPNKRPFNNLEYSHISSHSALAFSWVVCFLLFFLHILLI